MTQKPQHPKATKSIGKPMLLIGGILCAIGISSFLCGIISLSMSKKSSTSSSKSSSSSYSSPSEIQRRREWIQNVEDGFNEDSLPSERVHLTIIDSKTLQISGSFIEKEFAEKFIKRSDIVRPLRQNGFDFVLITNGKQQWKYDLWND